MEQKCPPGALIKVSIAFEPMDYEWAKTRAQELYGRRGMGLFIRKLVRDDKRFTLETRAQEVIERGYAR